MSWLSILGIVVVVVAIASVLGLGPRKGRPVASTHLMVVARVFLVLLGALLLYLGFKSR